MHECQDGEALSLITEILVLYDKVFRALQCSKV